MYPPSGLMPVPPTQRVQLACNVAVLVRARAQACHARGTFSWKRV